MSPNLTHIDSYGKAAYIQILIIARYHVYVI